MMMHNMTIAMGLPIGTCLNVIYLSCFMAIEAIIGPRNIASNNKEAEEYVLKCPQIEGKGKVTLSSIYFLKFRWPVATCVEEYVDA